MTVESVQELAGLRHIGRIIRAGDLVKIDLSAAADGYFADAAVTVAVPPVTDRARKYGNPASGSCSQIVNY